MRDNVHPATMPGGWALIDDSCLQYIRRHSPRTYELIEYGRCGQEGLFEVYTDIVCLSSYEKPEILNILNGFGYTGIEDVREKYGDSYDAANQIIAECIFEHLGSAAAVTLCDDVSESVAIQTILDHLAQNNDAPEYQNWFEISVNQLAKRINALKEGDEFTFNTEEDGNAFGVTRIRPFDADMIIINNYGGGRPCSIDLEWDGDAEKIVSITEGLMSYCACWEIETIFIEDVATSPASPAGADHVAPTAADPYLKSLSSMDHARCPKFSVLQQFLTRMDADDPLIVSLHTFYEQRVGINPAWRYPFCDGQDLGGVILPVREGFAMLTYNTMNSEDREIYEPERMYLIDPDCAEMLASDLAEYSATMAGVFQVIQEKGKATHE